MNSFLFNFISLFFNALWIALLARVLLSWVDPMGNMKISQIARELTEPILAPIRSILPSTGMIDLSPLIAFLLIQMLQTLILSALR
jgi:YggT family protein